MAAVVVKPLVVAIKLPRRSGLSLWLGSGNGNRTRSVGGHQGQWAAAWGDMKDRLDLNSLVALVPPLDEALPRLGVLGIDRGDLLRCRREGIGIREPT
jgi:hypothetical protein